MQSLLQESNTARQAERCAPTPACLPSCCRIGRLSFARTSLMHRTPCCWASFDLRRVPLLVETFLRVADILLCLARREQLEALQAQVADLQSGWEADRQALDDAVESAQTVRHFSFLGMDHLSMRLSGGVNLAVDAADKPGRWCAI